MSEETFAKIVHVWSQVVPDLQSHPDLLTKFIYLIEKIDGLPHMERRFHREGLSFYHAISKNRPIGELEEIFKVFFDEGPLSITAAPDSQTAQGVSATHLGGIQGEQVLLVKKIGGAEFYGALWPWKDKDDVVTVHLGVCAPGMSEENHEFMYSAMKGHLAESTSEKIDASVRGRIQGISLSSFLQMSEMEGSTCTLVVQSGNRTGSLHLLNGNLIDAETGSLKHRNAAYAILRWEDAEIDIQKPSGRQKNEIGLPLMHILMEALKKKDEFEFAGDTPGAGGGSKGLTSPGFGKDTVAFELSGGVLEGDGPVVQPEAGQEAVPGDAQKEDAVTGEAGPAKTSGKPAIKAGTHETLGPIGKKNNTPLIVVAVVVILLAGAGVYWFLLSRGGGAAAEDYAALMTRVESLEDDAEKEKLLMAFIDAHTDDPVYTDKAMQALFKVLSRVEASDYEKANQAVFNLPLDRRYHQQAEKIFRGFLQRHPESRYRDDISKRLAEIAELADDAHFSELNELDPRDYIVRLEACSGYLNAYPDGRHREEVDQFARDTLTASYREFSKNIEKCKQRKKWDDCLAACGQYRETFQRYVDMAGVDRIEAEIRVLKALDMLRAETEGADDQKVRKLYLAFLENYPDSPDRKRLEKRVAEIDRETAVEDEWLGAKTGSQDATRPLAYRIALLRRYIEQNPGSPYFIEAENLLWNLELQADSKKTTGSNAPAETGGAETEPASTATVVEKTPAVQDNAARLKTLRRKVNDALSQTRGRFAAAGGTVKDTITGRTWTMLDSYQVLGRCVDYRQAVNYVKELSDGGYTDWRMPTSAELAGIYQNSPYFPESGAEWYWSTEVYEKGYQTIANIVTAKPEAVYRKRTANIRECGWVRAVRP